MSIRRIGRSHRGRAAAGFQIRAAHFAGEVFRRVEIIARRTFNHVAAAGRCITSRRCTCGNCAARAGQFLAAAFTKLRSIHVFITAFGIGTFDHHFS